MSDQQLQDTTTNEHVQNTAPQPPITPPAQDQTSKILVKTASTLSIITMIISIGSMIKQLFSKK